MKVLLVGCGSIGKRHLRNLKTLGVSDLHAFDPRPDRVTEAVEQTGAHGWGSLSESLNTKPDLTLITTPNSLHLEAALEAARAGSHLFIEKPLSHTLEGINELLKETQQRNLTALVGCNMRFHPGIAAVGNEVKNGRIGRIVSARIMAGSYLPDWHPWEDYRKGYSARADLGGGAILDGIHEIDYLLDILGPAVDVQCTAGRFGDIEIETEDTAEILLRTEAGALANIHLSYTQRAYRRNCLFSGTEGSLEWDFDHPHYRTYLASTKQWEETSFEAIDVNEMYIREMKHLLACIRGEEKPAQDLNAGRAALEVACAAKRSSETGKRIELRQTTEAQ